MGAGDSTPSSGRVARPPVTTVAPGLDALARYRRELSAWLGRQAPASSAVEQTQRILHFQSIQRQRH